jgi:hypothetical protein
MNSINERAVARNTRESNTSANNRAVGRFVGACTREIPSAVVGAAVGGAVGTFLGPLGTFGGAAVGAFAGVVVSEVLGAVSRFAIHKFECISNWFWSKGYQSNDEVRKTDVKPMFQHLSNDEKIKIQESLGLKV